MECKHDQFRCTNNVFFCLKCGAEIPNPYEAKEEKPEEKKPAKRRAKKEVEKE